MMTFYAQVVSALTADARVGSGPTRFYCPDWQSFQLQGYCTAEETRGNR